MITAQSPRSPILGSTRVGILAPLVLVFACSGTADPNELNNMYGQGGSATAGTSTQGQAGSTAPVGGQPMGTAGSSSPTAGTQSGAGTSSMPSAGTGGSGGGSDAGGSSAMPMGGSAGSGVGGSTGGAAPVGPYAPRTGSFKMLVYSQNVTGGFKHPSIPDGQTMLKSIGTKQGFEVTVATDESEINATGLAKYEIVFFMNSTGEIFSADQRNRTRNGSRKTARTVACTRRRTPRHLGRSTKR